MLEYAENLDFERAAEIRDKIVKIEKNLVLNKIYKTAFITGGAQRIGESIATHLAKSGYNIAIQYNKSKRNALKVFNINLKSLILRFLTINLILKMIQRFIDYSKNCK